MGDMVWQRSEAWVGTEVEDSFVMINLETGTYLTLNSTAKAVWAALETPRTDAAIVEQLLERFDVAPADCTTAVTALLTRMRDLKIASPA